MAPRPLLLFVPCQFLCLLPFICFFLYLLPFVCSFICLLPFLPLPRCAVFPDRPVALSLRSTPLTLVVLPLAACAWLLFVLSFTSQILLGCPITYLHVHSTGTNAVRLSEHTPPTIRRTMCVQNCSIILPRSDGRVYPFCESLCCGTPGNRLMIDFC